MKNESASTSGRISRVFCISTGCPTRKSPAKRPARRLPPSRPTKKIRTTERTVSASENKRPKIRKCRADSNDSATRNQ